MVWKVFPIIIFLLCVGLAAPALANDELSLCDRHSTNLVTYESIMPLKHSISGGILKEFCVEPKYRWYVVYLDVKQAESLTVTIPKKAVDLKQFDYESCNPNDLRPYGGELDSYSDYLDLLHGNLEYRRIAQVVQTWEAAGSRTLEFTWSGKIDHIEYFGSYDIRGGNDHSEPNRCINLVESGLKSPDIDPSEVESCESSNLFLCELPGYRGSQRDAGCRDIDLVHAVTDGIIKRICADHVFYMVTAEFQPYSPTTKFSIDIPYTVLPPMTPYNQDAFVISAPYGSAGLNNGYSVNQTFNSQTFTFDPEDGMSAQNKITISIPIFIMSEQYTEMKRVAEFYNNLRYTTECEGNLIPILENGTVTCANPMWLEDQLLRNKTGFAFDGRLSCKPGFEQVLRTDGVTLVCAKPATVEKLIQRGWFGTDWLAPEWLQNQKTS